MRRSAKGGGAKDEREGGRNDEGRRGWEMRDIRGASYMIETLYAQKGYPFVDIEGGKNSRCTRVRCRYNQFIHTDFHRKKERRREATQDHKDKAAGHAGKEWNHTRDRHCPIRHNASICHKGSPLFRPRI